MDDLRSKSPLVRITVYALFGLLILSFGLWGVGDYLTSSEAPNEIADVDGTSIPLSDFENRLRVEARQIQQRTRQPLTQEMLMATGIAQRSMRVLVERALLDHQAKDLGLSVAPVQVLERIAQQPQFQNARGQFDQQRYLLTLQSSGLRPEQYEAEVRSDIERQYIVSSVILGAEMPNSGSERIFAWREEERTLSYVTVPAPSLDSLAKPDQATLEALYEERKSSFRAPEYRSVTLLHIQPDAFMETVEVDPAELAEAVAAQQESFGSPELRAWRQVIFQSEAEAAAAKAETEAGKSLVEASSAHNGSAPAALPLQPKSRVEGLLPQLADAVFADSKEGDIVLARTPLGWHVIEITQVVEREAAPPETVQASVEEDLKMDKAVSAMVSFVNEVDAELATGATLDETANQLGLQLRTIDAIDRRGMDDSGMPVTDLPAPQEFLELIFTSDSGVDSLLQEANDGSFFAFRVDEITPAADRPFADVEARVLSVWQREEVQRKAVAEAEALAQRIRTGALTFEAAAQELGQPVISAPAMSRVRTPPQLQAMPELVRAAFKQEAQTPFAVGIASGAALAQVTKIEAVKSADNSEGFEALQSALNRDMREDLLSGFIASLESVYPVRYNGEALEQALSRF
ncbi:MAG: SurA N-terminal domain-containing protein [Kiloniellales bacterium]